MEVDFLCEVAKLASSSTVCSTYKTKSRGGVIVKKIYCYNGTAT